MMRSLVVLLLTLVVCLSLGNPALTRARAHGAAAHPQARGAMASTPGNPWKGFTKTGTAVRRTLTHLTMACGHAVNGTGAAIFTPGIAGQMNGPHVVLQLSLHGARSGAHLELETLMRQGSIVRDDSSVGSLMVNGAGSAALLERTMPMIHPGTYTVQLLVHDLGCGSAAHHPLAYRTTPAPIVFKGMAMGM